MIRIHETLVRHASDVIRWRDATGRDDEFRAADDATLQIQLAEETDAFDVTLTHKPGVSVVWRKRFSEERPMRFTIDQPGRPSEDAIRRPDEVSFVLKGRVSDLNSRFNPRHFELTLGNHQYPLIDLYRTPDATPVSQNKVLQGLLRFEKQPSESTALPASWALITLEVELTTTGDRFRFHGQADIDGFFRLPVTRLSTAMLSSGFTAHFSVQADRLQSRVSVPDPATMTRRDIQPPSGGDFVPDLPVWADTADRRLRLSFVPASSELTTLILKNA